MLKDEEINNNQQHKKEAEFGAIKNVKQRSFLVAFSQLGNISKAAKRAKVDRSSHYKWIDPKHQLYNDNYQAAFKVAQKIAVEHLEAEARRRAVEGIEEPVFYKGEIVGHKMRYSDTLLMFLLKGNAPEKYKDRVEQQHTGEVRTKRVDLSHLSSEELQKIVDEL